MLALTWLPNRLGLCDLLYIQVFKNYNSYSKEKYNNMLYKYDMKFINEKSSNIEF